MSENKQAIALLWRLILGLLVVGGLSGVSLILLPKQASCLSAYGTSSNSARRSLGEEMLVSEETSEDKRAGVEAFAQCDFQTAAAKLEASLVDNRNDPEALIYLQNAKAAASGETLKIVASVPIGSQLDVAQEMLRGVAQAQQEVNRQGGMNGKQLLVEIANDDNDIKIVEKLAAEFVADTKILAVVGHNSSNASLAGAPIYEGEGLVMVSPTSGSTALSDYQNYVFRTIPSVPVYAEALANRVNNTRYNDEYLNKIAICADSQDSYSKSFKEQFVAAIANREVNVTYKECDLADPDFNARDIYQAIAEEADGLLLSASYKNLSNAISIIEANKKRLPLFATRNMYVNETIQEAGEDVEGMLLAVPWHRDADTGNFFTEAFELWNARVNWRTAMAYDATGAIIKGLKNGDSRKDLQGELSNPGFSLQGATGTVRFSQEGDRLVENGQQDVKLVTIRQNSEPEGGDEFVLLLQ